MRYCVLSQLCCIILIVEYSFYLLIWNLKTTQTPYLSSLKKPKQTYCSLRQSIALCPCHRENIWNFLKTINYFFKIFDFWKSFNTKWFFVENISTYLWSVKDRRVNTFIKEDCKLPHILSVIYWFVIKLFLRMV